MLNQTKNRLQISLPGIFWILILISGVISCLMLAFLPSMRTGPFGIGLPSKTNSFSGEYFPLFFDYPNSWTAFETEQGNHGDREIIAIVGVAGRSYPSVAIARKHLPSGDLAQAIEWGDDRLKRQSRDYVLLESRDYVTSYTSGFNRIMFFTEETYFGDKRIQCIFYTTVVGKHGYVLELCADYQDWAQVEETFMQIIHSFGVKNEI